MKILFTITHRHIIFFIILLLIFGSLAGVYIFERNYRNRFYPNIILGGERVGGKSYDEVLSRIKLVGDALKSNGIQLVIPTDHTTTTISISQRSVGLTPDVVVEYFTLGDYEKTVKEAYQYGRSGNIFNKLKTQFSLLKTPHIFVLPFSLRETSIESLLTREFETILKKSSDAYLARKNGDIYIVPEVEGERIDVPAVVVGMNDALVAMKTNRLQLSITPQLPLMTKRRLAGILDFANEVSRSLTFALEYRGAEVLVSGATLATWMTLKPEPGNSIVVRRTSVAELVRKYINSSVEDAPINSRFAMRDGVLTETIPGIDGSAASIDDLVVELERQLNNRYLMTAFPLSDGPLLTKEKISLPLVFSKEEPRITAQTISQFNIVDLVGVATTSFKGSTDNRKHNIATGVERVSGLLIAPGEEFSLVKAIGEVTEETGFEKEYVIKNDRSVKEAGGGLCQLATTVFRAAMNAGLKITERQNHSYVVGYYGPGLDATIYGPHPDLRFVNDTGEYLLFQMRTSGDSLIAEFYGKKDNRVVTISQPKLFDYIDPPPNKYLPAVDKPWGQQECTDQPRKGLTAEAVYTVQYDDGQVATQLFRSIYQPWPKICLVGIRIGEPPAQIQSR